MSSASEHSTRREALTGRSRDLRSWFAATLRTREGTRTARSSTWRGRWARIAPSTIRSCSRFTLGGLASFRTGGRELAASADEARESLALARQTGNPGQISVALAVLALVLVSSEPERSRALIAESMELNDALGAIVVDENALVMAVLVSALLGESDQLLEDFSARTRPRPGGPLPRLRRSRTHGRGTRPRRTPRRRGPSRSGRRADPRLGAGSTVSCSTRTRDRSHHRPTRRRRASASCTHKAPQ